MRTANDALSERWQRGVIDGLEVFNDMMVLADCGCDYADAIDVIGDVIAEQIAFYEERFGTWVPTELAAEVEE